MMEITLAMEKEKDMTSDQIEQMEKLCDAYRQGDRAELDVKLDKLRVEIKHNRELFDFQERASDKALELAREILKDKLTADNNIKGEMQKLVATFITKPEYEGKHATIETKIEGLAEKTNTMSGKVMLIIIGIPLLTSLVVSIATMFIFHMVGR